MNNSAASTIDVDGKITQATDYACDNTQDKIFLLSEYEATSYGFEAYDSFDSKRYRIVSDYARATGSYMWTNKGWWWLRSPFYGNKTYLRVVSSLGDTEHPGVVHDTSGCVVPALSISF